MWWCFFGDFIFGLNDVIDKLGCVEEMIKLDFIFNKYVVFENLFLVLFFLKWFKKKYIGLRIKDK